MSQLDSNKDASDSEIYLKAFAITTAGLVGLGGIAKGARAIGHSRAKGALIKDIVKAGEQEKLSKEAIQKRVREVKTGLENGKTVKDYRNEYFPEKEDVKKEQMNKVNEEIQKNATSTEKEDTKPINTQEINDKVAEEKSKYTTNKAEYDMDGLSAKDRAALMMRVPKNASQGTFNTIKTEYLNSKETQSLKTSAEGAMNSRIIGGDAKPVNTKHDGIYTRDDDNNTFHRNTDSGQLSFMDQPVDPRKTGQMELNESGNWSVPNTNPNSSPTNQVINGQASWNVDNPEVIPKKTKNSNPIISSLNDFISKAKKFTNGGK